MTKLRDRLWLGALCVLAGCIEISLDNELGFEGSADLALSGDCSGENNQVIGNSCAATFSGEQEFDFSSVRDALQDYSGSVASCSLSLSHVQLMNGENVVSAPGQIEDYSLTFVVGGIEVITLTGQNASTLLEEPLDVPCTPEVVQAVNAAANSDAPLQMHAEGLVQVALDEIPTTTSVDFEGTLNVTVEAQAF